MTRKLTVAMVMIIAASLRGAMPSVAQTAENTSEPQPTYHNDVWHVGISPYLWLAGLDGTIGVGAHEAQINQSFTDIFDHLKFGVMGLTEVRRGRIGILTDLMYVRLGNEAAIPIEGLPSAVNVKASVNTFTLTPYFDYRILGGQRGAIDWIFGGRYYHVESTISAETGGNKVSFHGSDNWGDFVQGGRFRFNVTPRIQAFFLGDVGVGGSQMTWQIVGGARYQWSKKWSTDLGYRRLYFDRQTGGFTLDQTQQGLIMGVTHQMR